MADLKARIRAYALANALKYGGKANANNVLPKIIAEFPDERKNVPGLKLVVDGIVEQVNDLDAGAQRTALEESAPELLDKKSERRTGLPELKNVAGKVRMRIAPYPSGPLQLGNAKQLLLNDEYVKKYGGEFLVVVDDTIGSEEKNILPEAYDLIMEGVDWLGCSYQRPVLYKSDRLPTYYEYALKIIEKDKAYVCFCGAETLRKNREESAECEHRGQSVERNKALWQEMLDGKHAEGTAVLRLKTDMQHKNPAFRDRVLFRISNRAHPRVGNKYHVWPLLEFSWGIDDHLLGITHVLRGKDLLMESEMERYIWDIFGWPHCEIIHTGILSIEGIKISKSKSKKEVLSGQYIGWDDPRTWSLQSLRRRGFRPEAIRNFIVSTGVTQNDITVPVDTLYSENKKFLDPIADRYFFIAAPVPIIVEGAPERAVELHSHPKHERGKRGFAVDGEFFIPAQDHALLEENGLYRLMDCLNFRKEGDSLVFDSLEVERYRERGTRIMHWLPAKESLPAEVLMPDATVVKGLVERNIRRAKPGDVVQFERFGFCRFDALENGVYKFWFAHK